MGIKLYCICFLLGILICWGGDVAAGDTIVVPDDFALIQDAIDAASDGDRVLVRPGTYTGNIQFRGKAIVVRSENGPIVTHIEPDQPGSVVMFNQDEQRDTVLEGFTILNGSSGGISNYIYGAGIQAAASPTIRNNIIRNNGMWAGRMFGGGIYSTGSPLITGNIIVNNHAWEDYSSGGGGFGGGVYCAGNACLINNLIAGNIADFWGGGIYIESGASPLILNNTLNDNFHWHSQEQGQEIYCCSTRAVIKNSIIWNSYLEGIPLIEADDCTPSVTYCDVMGGYNGIGNIDHDPLFIRGAYLEQDPVQPGVDNPCVDGGDPGTPLIIGTTRTDGVYDSGIVDIGYHLAGAPRKIVVPDDFATIQEAIDAASFDAGDEIVVRPGTYFEQINFMTKPVALKSMLGPGHTVISCDSPGLRYGKSVVIFWRSLFNTESIEGFTITGGTGTYWESHTFWGGGIFCCGSPTIANNVITGNRTRGWGLIGAGIAVVGGSPLIVNNTIVGNTADERAGGLYSWTLTPPIVKNTIFWDNGYDSYVPEIGGLSGTDAVQYCCVEDGHPGMANISTDPMFFDPETGDYHLTWDSPCREAGDNTCVSTAIDFEGDPRIVSGWVDIGADEYHSHVYHLGRTVPGKPKTIRIVGSPGAPARLGVSSQLLDTPVHTNHGDFWLKMPLLESLDLGVFPSTGILSFTKEISQSTDPGTCYALQVLVGPAGNPDSILTNPLLLRVNYRYHLGMNGRYQFRPHW